MNPRRTELILFVILTLVLIALELVSAILAYETIGAVASTLYFFALAINLVFLALAIRSRTAAAVGLVLLALALVPYQFMLAQRWMRAQTEADRIVAYAYDQRLTRGAFPTGLADYRFRDPEMRTYIQGFNLDPSRGGFILCYYVGTESTSHCFSPKDSWTYDPD